MVKLLLTGNIGANPESFVSAQNVQYCKFSVAAQKLGNKSDVIWINCTVFGKKVDYCVKYLEKGVKVVIEGDLTSYKGKDGVVRYGCNVINIESLNYKGESSETALKWDNTKKIEEPEVMKDIIDGIGQTVNGNDKKEDTEGLPWDIEF